MKPENVNPGNFKVEKILFNNNEFSIAYGMWNNESEKLGMRWNGSSDNDPGYPKVFRNPMWFMVDEGLTIPFLKSIISSKGSNDKNILEILNKIL